MRSEDPGLSGMAAGYLLSMGGYLALLVRFLITTDILMASTARIKKYSELPSEPKTYLPNDRIHKAIGWPH
eukprot:CAMPEP_0114575902 /NCGR_PEP_ID=MMETSP0125-20121206/720_1 /TAXON_ID=485358 ORGANISM="Aristerostoma sp., Strain ATCC 50986" /NCGR_SAMPLE_ID=MMETSP0125 /ASSEMBLY_ACC=CAM_ASM_000245 /LENGTH=70 /DNA_ID=CAMNT_0001763993 /DNA_START=3042 /DNA_END=3254 /DNA_ORIENTATION=-